jgi:hypothetical protein
MATNMISQKMFTTGEVDATVFKRTDINDYLTSAQSLLNFEIDTVGLARKRKGTTFLANITTQATVKSSLYEFSDQRGNYYVIIGTGSTWNAFKVYPTFSDTPIPIMGTIPYGASDTPSIDYTQDNDTIVLAHPNFPPARIYISDYGSDPFTFTYAELDIYPLPAYDFSRINYNSYGVTISSSGSTLTFVLTGVGGTNPGFNSDWVGGQIVGGGTNVDQPLGYAIITNVVYSSSGSGTVTFTATIQLPFATGSSAAPSGSQYSIKQPVWKSGQSSGYPATVLYFQNRLWFGNTQNLNNTIFGSKINTPVSFDVGIASDTDAIIYTIGETNSGPIVWLNGGKQLEIYCKNLEFVCPQDQNTGLTPSTFSIRQQSAYGASNTMKPITYLNDSYFVNLEGKALINFHFNGIGLSYQSSNISAASSHLIKAPVNRAILRGDSNSQDNFIYLLNPTPDPIPDIFLKNSLTAFQFASEYKLAALTPIEFQDEVYIIDIVSVNNSVYLLKYYKNNLVFTLETFDESIKIDCNQIKAINTFGGVPGLDILNGYKVQVMYNGEDYGQFTVVAGSITVVPWIGIATNVQIGLLYECELIPMYVFAGTQESPFFKSLSRIYVDYYNTLNFTINDTLVPYQSFAQIQTGNSLESQTGTAIYAPVLGWDRFQTFRIYQNSPFDCQILGIAYQIRSAAL